MKKILTTLSLLLLATAIHAQQRDTMKHKENEYHRMTRFIGQRLNVDSVKARQVEIIQSSYKSWMAQLMANRSLSDSKDDSG